MSKRSFILVISALLIVISFLVIFFFILPGETVVPPRSVTVTVPTSSTPPPLTVADTSVQPPPEIIYPVDAEVAEADAMDARISIDGNNIAYVKYNKGTETYALIWHSYKNNSSVEIVGSVGAKPAYPLWDRTGQYLAYAILQEQGVLVYIYDTINAALLTPGGIHSERSLFFEVTISDNFTADYLYKRDLTNPYFWSGSLLVISAPAAVYDVTEKTLLLDFSSPDNALNKDYISQKYAALSPDRTRLATIGIAEHYTDIIVTEIAAGISKAVYRREYSDKHCVEYLRWFNNNSLLFDVITDNIAVLKQYNIKDGEAFNFYKYSSSAGGYCLMSPDRKYLAIVDLALKKNSETSLLTIYDMSTGIAKQVLGSPCPVYFFSDNSDMLIGISEKTAYVWNLSGEELFSTPVTSFGAPPQLDSKNRLLLNNYRENMAPRTVQPSVQGNQSDDDPPPPSIQDEVYKIAQSFATAMRNGDINTIEALSLAQAGTYAEWANMSVSSPHLEMVEQEGAYGLFKLSMTISDSTVDFFPDGTWDYYFTVNYSLYYGDISVISICRDYDAPYTPPPTPDTVKSKAASLAYNFFNFMGQLEFLSVDDLPAEVMIDYAVICLAAELGEVEELPTGFAVDEVDTMIGRLFNVYDVDGLESYLYDAETNQYLLWGRGGYAGYFRMPKSTLTYIEAAGIFICEIWFFADPLQTEIASRMVYTLNATVDSISFISAEFFAE